MKRYFAFYGDVYYPLGGMGDFETQDAAESAVKNKHLDDKPHETEWDMSWGVVWDSETKSKVFEK